MYANPILLAFGFANLAMLGWLAAAAAPLLIHLWSRRKYREVPWAAVTFLLAAMRRTSRRIQIQQWLLLAVRTLIIALVVFAVAEPYGVGSLAGGLPGGPAHKVLVIDGSYSMATRGGEATHFARAKRLAAQLVRDSGPSDVFTLIVMAEPATKILGRDVIDHAAVISQIDSLAQPHTGADLSGALTRIGEALDDTSAGSGLRSEVYFFTDMQRRTWGASAGDSQRTNEALAALGQRAALVAVDLGVAAATNLAVTRLSTLDPFVTTGSDTTFEATLHQFGDQPRNTCRVELLVDGVPVAEQTLDIPAGGDVAARFAYRFRAAGDHTIAVRAANDALVLDDTRWLVVPVRDEVRVLCVAGKAGAARYVADALDPDPTDASPVRPIVVSEGDLAELELAQFDCVFLCNVGQLTPGEAERLRRYAEAGGGVVLFLGDRTRPEAWNEQAASLTPAQIGALIAAPTFGIDPLEYRHPIVAPFRGRERAGLLTTPIARYYRLEVSPDRAGAEVAAALPGGEPWIVTAPLGRGRTVLIATDGALSSVDSETGEPWTAWPTWPSFLPVVREIMAYAVGGQREMGQQPVGSPLAQRDREPLRVGEVVEVTRPDGRTGTARVENGPDGGVWNYSETDHSGIYSVRAAGSAAPQPYAINLNTAESDLAKVDPSQLPPELSIRAIPQAAAGGIASDLAAGDLLPRSNWQQTFLLGAFGLLLVESLLAWHFGRGVL